MKSETRMFRVRADMAAGLGDIGRREMASAILRREPEADFNQATGGSRRRIGDRLNDLAGDIGIEPPLEWSDKSAVERPNDRGALRFVRWRDGDDGHTVDERRPQRIDLVGGEEPDDLVGLERDVEIGVAKGARGLGGCGGRMSTPIPTGRAQGV